MGETRLTCQSSQLLFFVRRIGAARRLGCKQLTSQNVIHHE